MFPGLPDESDEPREMSDEKPKPRSKSRRNLLLVGALLALTYGGYRVYLERKPSRVRGKKR